jgi:hypothetical protein
VALVTADDAIGVAVMAAQAMCDYAAVFVDTLEMPPVMGNGLGGPVTLVEGGVKWNDAADQLQQAQQTLQALVAGLPHDYWDGDDRAAFDNEMTQLQAQLGDSHNYAMAVGIVLDALAVPIGLWPVMCTAIGLVEAAFASAFYAAAASVVGDFGPSEAIYAAGEAASATCLTVLNASMGILIGVMAAATAAIAISDIADVSEQEKNGDTTALSDFGKAAVSSLPEVGFNLLVDHLNKPKEGGEGDDEPHVPGKHEAPTNEGGTHEDPGGANGGDAAGTHEAPTGEGGRHEDPEGGTGSDTDDAPGSHEDPSGEPGPDSSPGDGTEGTHHAPHHSKEPDWDEIYQEHLKEYAQDKAKEKLGDYDGSGLSSIINGLIGPSDQPPEKWGEEPQTESV